MDLPDQIYTWRGLPFTGSRPLQKSELEAITIKIQEHERHAWIWKTLAALCVLSITLIFLPILLMLLGVDALWCIGLAAILFMVAGTAFGLLEIAKPASRFRRTLFTTFLICAFGFIGSWMPGGIAPAIGKVMSLIGLLCLMLGGGGLGLLRSIDRWRERTLYRRLKEDRTAGMAWGFGEYTIQNDEHESKLPIAEVLPQSGMVVSLRSNPFPKTAPVLPMAAAPRPAKTWEIPSQFQPPPGLTRGSRQLTESERAEGASVLAAARKRVVFAGLSLLFSGTVLYWGALVPRMAPTPEGHTAAALLAVVLPAAFLWLIGKRWIRLRRFAVDMRNGRVEVFRVAEASDEGQPFAELLPLSRFVWMWQGRLGSIRLARQEPGVKR